MKRRKNIPDDFIYFAIPKGGGISTRIEGYKYTPHNIDYTGLGFVIKGHKITLVTLYDNFVKPVFSTSARFMSDFFKLIPKYFSSLPLGEYYYSQNAEKDPDFKKALDEFITEITRTKISKEIVLSDIDLFINRIAEQRENAIKGELIQMFEDGKIATFNDPEIIEYTNSKNITWF
ncbi:MAG: hypothetical protein ABH851_03855 [Methanobacteriota archaeon]